MRCATCNFELNPAFKHAISKNECPACGGQIMDEETMALIEDMENTILAEAAVRGETARSLAMVLAARYDISLRTGVERAVARQPALQSQPMEEEIKIAQPSAIQQAMIDEDTGQNIVKVSELVSGNLSESEREEIMAEAVKEKMNMVESVVMPEELDNTVIAPQPRSPEADAMSSALFGNGGENILEEERMLRLAKQQRAMGSGSGGFRRGS